MPGPQISWLWWWQRMRMMMTSKRRGMTIDSIGSNSQFWWRRRHCSCLCTVSIELPISHSGDIDLIVLALKKKYLPCDADNHYDDDDMIRYWSRYDHDSIVDHHHHHQLNDDWSAEYQYWNLAKACSRISSWPHLASFLALWTSTESAWIQKMIMIMMKIILKKMMKIISMKTQVLCFVHN